MMKRFLATAVTAATLAAAPQARADTWGCEVLLCLSNPAGPMAVSQCVRPIQRLYRAIFKWRPDPFPTCIMSSGQDSSTGGNFARVGPPSYYDACPSGTTPLPAGERAALGVYSDRRNTSGGWGSVAGPGYNINGPESIGIGDGSGLAPDSESGAMPPKVCVGQLVGSHTYTTGWGRDRERFSVGLYDRVEVMQPAPSTFNIQVYLNNQLYTNVRPGF